jgi:hypothetical protein
VKHPVSNRVFKSAPDGHRLVYVDVGFVIELPGGNPMLPGSQCKNCKTKTLIKIGLDLMGLPPFTMFQFYFEDDRLQTFKNPEKYH